MINLLKFYFQKLQEKHNRVLGLILGSYQPDVDKPDQGLITTADGRSFKANLIERVKSQYYRGLDLSQPMLFTVHPSPKFGVGFILTVVKITYPNKDQFNHPPEYLSIAERVLAKYSGFYWLRQRFLSFFS